MKETLTDLSRALAEGQTSSEALVALCLARIAEKDGVFNSFVHVDLDGARTAARASDDRRAAGMSLSPLDGLPISIKDSLLVAHMPATWGSRALKDHVPVADELPVARLRAAGAVLIGKTNVPELTVEGYTRNDLFGATRNPLDPRLTPGGSSGGAAASVAGDLVPAAIGTDGGGSIRRPASHTGLVGWKPSNGRFARAGGFPSPLADFETVGTLTRTVADARLLDAVLSGPDATDRRSFLPVPHPPRSRPFRILYLRRFGTAPVDPEVAEVTAAFAKRLERAGHQIEDGEVFFDLAAFARVWQVISRAGIAALVDRSGWPLADLGGASVRRMAEEGRQVSGVDYVEALAWVAEFRRRCDALFGRIDWVLTPTAAALPWPVEADYPDRIGGAPAGPRDHAIFTGWVNAGGLPAISLPVGSAASGLPIGVQLVAGVGRDDALLAFAETLLATPA